MSNKENKPGKGDHKPVKKEEEEAFPGYPAYPADEDIMNKRNGDKEVDIDMNDLTGSFRHNSELPTEKRQPADKSNEQEETWRKDKVGDDLDIPGAELDDEAEAIGEEDEENNIYSIGGDRHEDLEEDNGEFLDLDEEKN
jgi:Asp-tRNA(Asn)/Glu-tRNA(Gln) amidotransferase C subunit